MASENQVADGLSRGDKYISHSVGDFKYTRKAKNHSTKVVKAFVKILSSGLPASVVKDSLIAVSAPRKFKNKVISPHPSLFSLAT